MSQPDHLAAIERRENSGLTPTLRKLAEAARETKEFLKKEELMGTSNNRSFSGFVDGFGWRR